MGAEISGPSDAHRTSWGDRGLVRGPRAEHRTGATDAPAATHAPPAPAGLPSRSSILLCKPGVRNGLSPCLAIPAAGARSSILHHSDGDRSRPRVRPHGRARESARACLLHGDDRRRGLRDRKPARRGDGLHPRDVGSHREGAVAVPARPADRAEGGVRATVYHVARLQLLAEADRHHPGRLFSHSRECAAIDEDGRPRPDRSCPRLQHESHADFLEDRDAGLDAGADGGAAHRRDACGDRGHRRRIGRRQYRTGLSHHFRRGPGQYRNGVQCHRAADPDRHRSLRRAWRPSRRGSCITFRVPCAKPTHGRWKAP